MADRELIGEIGEVVDDLGMGEFVDGLAAYCEEQARDGGPQDRDWHRLAEIFRWVAGKVDDLGLS